jgi:putative ABC transport system permease protein
MPFALALAWRESRSFRRLGLLTAAVTAGVAALVAINSFTDNLQESVRDQARSLLGADLSLSSANPLTPAAQGVVKEMAGSGTAVASTVSFGAMAYSPGAAGTRLVQAVAVEGGYPFYGRIGTDPPEAWSKLGEGGGVLVDPALVTALGVQPGGTLALGEGRFTVRGLVTHVPGDVGMRAAFGPRVFLAARDVPATGLLTFGSRARYETLLKLPASVDAQKLADRHRAVLGVERVNVRTVSEDQRNLNNSLGRLGRYLSLVGLVSLLLGGLGVASAVHALLKRKLETIAVLRCLGASARQVFTAYLIQAAGLGLVGSLVGAALGAGLQVLVPGVLRGLLPVDVVVRPSWPAIGIGLLLGLWVSVMFSLLPLLGIRQISPLALLRRPYQDEASRIPRDWRRLVAALALALSVVAVALLQAPNPGTGLVFAAAVGLSVFALWLAARTLMRGVRRFFPTRWPYVWRQGLANLYRPANQTVMVVLALGFGAFLLHTVLLVQHNLLGELQVDGNPRRPNLALFDIQPDQKAPMVEALRKAGLPPGDMVPIVPMRIRSVKGTPAESVLGAPVKPNDRERSPRWAYRREYRSTYRDSLTASEAVVAGAAWAPGAGRGTGPVPISMEEGLARDLKVGVGDEIVWDVQGVAIPSRVAALRQVEWARFEPNFFVVFAAGPLDTAPQTFATLARLEDPGKRALFQRKVVESFPNVTAVDLSQMQQALEAIVSRVALAIRFMALFSLATGLVVLLGAVASSRQQRVREGVLLKALGATRHQVLRVLLAEYLSLGTLSAVAGLALAAVAAWALLRFVFEAPFALPVLPVAGLSGALVLLTVLVGVWSGREVFGRPPLESLRAE